VVWLDDNGKSALYTTDGAIKPAVKRLIDAGYTVLGADLLLQGEFLADGKGPSQTRLVENPREFAGYTFGYNSSLFAQRTHDVLTLVNFLRKGSVPNQPNPVSVAVAGFGRAGAIVAAARAVAGNVIDRAAVDTHGFRFAQLLDYRDPQFLPGGAKYLDVPGLLALGAPHPLWLAGETNPPALATTRYAQALTIYSGPSADQETSAANWLMQ
jgi:hypothetical protein